MDRRTGRTSKTAQGARRKTIISSALESLKFHLDRFSFIEREQRSDDLATRRKHLHPANAKSGLFPSANPILEKLVPTE